MAQTQADWQIQRAGEGGPYPELMDHQLKAIEKMGNGRILNGGVGTGKTITSLGYYYAKEAPRDVYVITTAKKRDSLDWEKEALKFGITTDGETSLAGTLKVDSWNNIQKYVGVYGAFFIFDEQRLVGSGAWVKSFLKIANKNHWILLSATPGDTWLDYAPVFVANGFYKNVSEFKREHCVYTNYGNYPKLERYLGSGRLVRLRNQIMVEMPYFRHTVRRTVHVPVEYDQVLVKDVIKRRWHPFEDRPLKDASELYALMRKIINSDPSRLDAVRELMKKHNRLIVFYNHNPELEVLRGLSDEVDVFEWNGHKHQDLPRFTDDSQKWVYLVQYQAGAEGWDCVSTNATVFYTLTYSFKIWQQAHGRIDRLNTKYIDLFYYVLRSKSALDQGIYQALLEKRDFNGLEFQL